VAAPAIGGGDGFDLHRCRGGEHEVHDLPAYSFPMYGGSLAHEFNDSFISVGLKPGLSLCEFRRTSLNRVGGCGNQESRRNEYFAHLLDR
jgi:hypothetical protein